MLAAGADLADVAFAVCTALERGGETAVLCGGSAAAFYVPDRYRSLDLDFVLQVGAAAHVVNRALGELGYARIREGFYEHPALPFSVEFPVGPLAVGRDKVTTWTTRRRGADILHVLHAHDVVRDRFLHYWAWGDETALGAALAVARANHDAFDWAAFRAWTARERAADPTYDPVRLDAFVRALEREL